MSKNKRQRGLGYGWIAVAMIVAFTTFWITVIGWMMQ